MRISQKFSLKKKWKGFNFDLIIWKPIYLNKGNFEFERISLPQEVQFSPVYAINTSDFDNDGDKDIVMGGNLFNVKPEVGIYDASYGIYLENINGRVLIFIPVEKDSS